MLGWGRHFPNPVPVKNARENGSSLLSCYYGSLITGKTLGFEVKLAGFSAPAAAEKTRSIEKDKVKERAMIQMMDPASVYE
jgi:hypothetical protein